MPVARLVFLLCILLWSCVILHIVNSLTAIVIFHWNVSSNDKWCCCLQKFYSFVCRWEMPCLSLIVSHSESPSRRGRLVAVAIPRLTRKMFHGEWDFCYYEKLAQKATNQSLFIKYQFLINFKINFNVSNHESTRKCNTFCVKWQYQVCEILVGRMS